MSTESAGGPGGTFLFELPNGCFFVVDLFPLPKDGVWIYRQGFIDNTDSFCGFDPEHEDSINGFRVFTTLDAAEATFLKETGLALRENYCFQDSSRVNSWPGRAPRDHCF